MREGGGGGERRAPCFLGITAVAFLLLSSMHHGRVVTDGGRTFMDLSSLSLSPPSHAEGPFFHSHESWWEGGKAKGKELGYFSV